MKHFPFITFFLLICSGGTALFASGAYNSDHEISPFFIPSTRNLALGGPHVAYTNDINSLFINPAVFKNVKQLSAAELSLGIYGDSLGLRDLIKNLNDTKELTDTLSDFINRSNGNIPLGFDLRGPIAIGNIKNGWGWGVFDRFYGGAQVNGRDIQVWGKADLMFELGYSFRVLDLGVHTLDVGVLGKVFDRVEINSGKIALTELISNRDVFMTRFNFIPNTLGTGLDLGAQYRLLDNFTVGLTVNDLFSLGYVSFYNQNRSSGATSTPSSYVGYIKPNINLGVSYKLFDSSAFSWAVMADYRDFINLFRQKEYDSRNGWLNFSFGTELTLYKHLTLRAGLNEMLPAVGIGLDLVIFKLDAALYGKELGNEPGGISTYAMDVGLLFRY
ncbi:MAG: conjugal transfer protein TraF [Spirochaetaceae bacterium]|nr:conjugal transfer protein TraF [Spirochaetaceae bacterium]